MTNADSDQLELALQALRPEIRAMLSEDLPEDLRRAEQAFARREWAALHSHVHRVNGSASFCKLLALKDACAAIEVGLKREQLPEAAAMQELSREISRVLEALGALPEVG